MLGYAMFVGSTNPQVRYAATFLIAVGAFSFGALCNSWAAINTTSDDQRAATIACVVFGGNLGGLVSTWSYLPKFAPNQIPGESQFLAFAHLYARDVARVGRSFRRTSRRSP